MGMVKAERVVVVAQGLIDDTSLVLITVNCLKITLITLVYSFHFLFGR
jgi:hypothetical protein